MRFTTIFFDLDDTLYPASSGLWPALQERMNRYMVERMAIPEQDVPDLRERYFRTYGTTLRGLQANHKLDVEDYLAYVHDVRLTDYIRPDPDQQAVLASLPTRNIIFTNADLNHAHRVLQVLQIEPYFAAMVDVNAMDPYCKPSAEAFTLALKISWRERSVQVRHHRRPASYDARSQKLWDVLAALRRRSGRRGRRRGLQGLARAAATAGWQRPVCVSRGRIEGRVGQTFPERPFALKCAASGSSAAVFTSLIRLFHCPLIPKCYPDCQVRRFGRLAAYILPEAKSDEGGAFAKDRQQVKFHPSARRQV